MKKIKEIIENKTLKIIIKTLKTAFVIFIACFVLVVFIQRFSNNKFSFLGFRIYTVVTGSMEPKYNVFDVLVSKETKPSEIKVGDAVTYSGEKGDVAGKLVTHNVEKIEQDDDGKYLFYTKGIASISMDPVVKESQIYGVVVYKSVILSFVSKIISNPFGFFLCIILPGMVIVGHEVFVIALKREKEKLLGE